jgi:transposase-like protein
MVASGQHTRELVGHPVINAKNEPAQRVGFRGYFLMPKIVEFNPVEENEIVSLYLENGLTVADIGRLKECSSSPILRVLRDKSVPMRVQGDELKSNRNQKILDLSEQRGMSLEDIARTVGVTRQRVHQIVTRGY